MSHLSRARKFLVSVGLVSVLFLTSCGSKGDLLPDETVSYAFGDSTVSLSDGVVVETRNGCNIEEGAWPSLLGGKMINLSCPGNDIKETIDIVRHSDIGVTHPDYIFLTVGSNQMRNDNSLSVSRQDLQSLVELIQGMTPDTRIYFVGYLHLDNYADCIMDTNNKSHIDYSAYLDTLHDRADNAMREVARRTGIEFINTRDLDYDVCSDTSYIRLPWVEGGASWHTTGLGHIAIADRILKNIS